MKSKFFIAALAAALCVLAFIIFNKGFVCKPPIKPIANNRLTGTWQLDSNNANFSQQKIIFGSDSSVQLITNEHQNVAKYYVTQDSLLLVNDSSITAFKLDFNTDSNIELTAKDSLVTKYSLLTK